jgi:hypothetical protein
MAGEVAELVQTSACRIDESNFGFSILSGIKSEFGVPPEKLSGFLGKYCELATKDEDEGDELCEDYEYESTDRFYQLNIGEVIKSSSYPVIGVHNFMFEAKEEDLENTVLFGQEFVNALVYSYQRAIAEVLNISASMKEFTAAVLTTPIWIEGRKVCFTIELRFPYCVVDKVVQRTKLRPKIITSLRLNNVLGNLAFQPVGDWDQIIMDNGTSIPLYRSNVEENSPPSKLTNIYSVMEGIEDIDAEIELEDIFRPEEHSYLQSGEITEEFLEEEEDVNCWIPLFLSISFYDKTTTAKRIKINRREEKVNSNLVTGINGDINNIQTARTFISMIRNKTMDQEHNWLNVGRALYSVSGGSKEGFATFFEASNIEKKKKKKRNVRPLTPMNREKPKPRDIETCKKLWKTFKRSKITIKTLAEMAKNDNQISYEEWHTAWTEPALNEAIDDPTDVGIAEAIYRIFWLEFICTNLRPRKWYSFSKGSHRLVPSDSGFKLRQKITNVVVPILERMRGSVQTQQLEARSHDGSGGGENNNYEAKILKIGKLCKKLKTTSVRAKVVEMCAERFYVEDFNSFANKGMISAWPNCVIEICGGKAVARPGKLEDYITKAGATDYNTTLSWKHPAVIAVMEYLGQVFPSPELLEYAIKDFASYLYPKNAEKKFRVWTGNGHNSKSILVKILQIWMGELCVDVPVSVYTGAKNSGGPSPELAQTASTLLGISAEPDDGDDIKAGAIKRNTGGDRFFGRNCNENGGSIDLNYKPIYMCNSIPNMPNVDAPTIDRFAFLCFFSKWSMNAPKDPEEQMRTRTFQMDTKFEDKLPEFAEPLFWIAVQYFPKYMKEGLNPPEEIVQYTKEHWRDHDPFQSFMFEKMRKVDFGPDDKTNDGNSITATDLYTQFKPFFRGQYGHSDIPAAPQFKTQMCQRLGKQVNRRWQGWVIKDID